MTEIDPNVPHRYVPPNVSRWRTCEVCGRGANQSIHRNMDDDSGSAYGFTKAEVDQAMAKHAITRADEAPMSQNGSEPTADQQRA